MSKFLEKLRFWLLRQLIRFVWWADYVLEDTPHLKQKQPIFFIPLAVAIPLILSGVSFGANLLISSLLSPKPRPQVRGKLTGDITLTDSIFGAPIPRIYGKRPAGETAGGVEVGGNIIWATEIRKIQTTVPGGGGGGRGGKGGGSRTPPTIEIKYKIDLAIAVGVGPLRLLRLKLNEDTVYNINGLGGGGTPVAGYEAEALVNTLSSGAVIADDAACSGGKKVTSIGGTNNGVLIFQNIVVDSGFTPNVPIDPGDEIPVPYLNVEIRYKSVGDRTCYVLLDGFGGLYSFPDTAGQVGSRFILLDYSAGTHTLEFNRPGIDAPEIDRINIEVIEIFGTASPSGQYNAGFPAEEPQNNMLLPDPRVRDTNPGERYNLLSTPEDGVLEITLANGANMAWYEGRTDQPVDAVIAANLGATSTPAFRGTAYCRLQNLDFTKYGSVPLFRFVVENTTTGTVSEICLAEALASGLAETDLDLTIGENKNIRGYFVAGIESSVKVFEDMGLIHNLTYTESNDGQIVCRDLDDRTVAATITANDLGAYIADEQTEPPLDDLLTVVPDETVDFIRTLELQFNNPVAPSDYASDRQTYTYPYTNSVRTETRQVNATLTAAEAALIIQRELQKHHLKTDPFSFSIPHKFAYLNAADVVSLQVGDEFKRVRIEEKTGSAPGIYEISATSEDIDYIVQLPGTSTSQPVKLNVSVPANTVGTLLDIPSLQDGQTRAGVYAAACSRDLNSGSWGGAVVYRAKGVDFQQMATFSKSCTIGVVADSALGNKPSGTGPNAPDMENSLVVDFFGTDTPTSVTDEQILDGANAFVVGDEVVKIKTWTRDNSQPNRWTGTEIYRQQKNTKEEATTTHLAGERVVFLNDAVQFIALDEDEVGVERIWKFVTAGQNIEDAAPVDFTWTGANMAMTKFDVAGHLISRGDAPTITKGDGAGTGVAAVASIEGTDVSGEISVTTDMPQTDQVIAVIYFAETFASMPNVLLTAGNSTAAMVDIYRTTYTDRFEIFAVGTLADAETYKWSYFVTN